MTNEDLRKLLKALSAVATYVAEKAKNDNDPTLSHLTDAVAEIDRQLSAVTLQSAPVSKSRVPPVV
jgi:hypothetical protein